MAARPPSVINFLACLGLDWATAWAVLLRVWQLLAGLVTVILMTQHFDLPTQGYYYLFASLIALQSFFELGLTHVVVSVCSHEWSQLRLEAGYITGDAAARSRLISLGRQLAGWSAVVQVLFFLVVGTLGAWYLQRQADVSWNWQGPWWTLVLVSACQLGTLPFVAMLEGCNQVAEVHATRFAHGVTANLAVWLVMIAGGGVWALAAASATRIICDGLLVGVRYRRFFAPFWYRASDSQFAWFREFWPLQWRVALGSVFAYFGFFLLTPVMFQYHGPRVAGQMGLTWTVVTAVQAAALAWVQTRTPRFGMLVRENRYRDLDRLFLHVTSLALLAMFLASAAYFFLLLVCRSQGWPFSDRVLAPLPTALLLTAAWCQVLIAALVCYVRAHKREPFLMVGIISNSAIGWAIWLLGARFGPAGAGLGLLSVVTCLTLPFMVTIWLRCRADQRLHARSHALPPSPDTPP